MAATTATVSDILQRKYIPGVKRQFNASHPLLRYIRQNSEDIDAQGEQAIIAIELGLNEGGGFHGESADVPQSGAPRIRTVNVTLKQMTFRARLTYKLMRKARTNANAFARGTQLQLEGTRLAMTLRAQTYLWGDGSGVVARVHAEDLSGSDTITFDRAFGLTNGGSPQALIRPGMRIHILDTKGFTGGVTTDRGVGIVAAVDDQTGNAGEIDVTFEDGYTFSGVTADDYVYIENTIEGWTDPGEEEDNRPAMGMLGFYDDTLRNPLQGLNTSDEPQWKPRKVPIAQATAVQNMRTAKNQVAKAGGGNVIKFLISSYETHERYAGELDEKVEFRNVRTIDGMWEVATFDGKPWFLDHMAPDATVFFVPTAAKIARYAVDNFINVLDEGGGALKLVPNKTVYDALFTAIYEYGISRRNALVSGTGMTWAPGSTPGS